MKERPIYDDHWQKVYSPLWLCVSIAAGFATGVLLFWIFS